MEELKYIVSVMKQEKHQREWRAFAPVLEAEGLCCMEEQKENAFAEHTMVITDDGDTAAVCERAGIVCIGYCPLDMGELYFPHVQMVLEDFEGMDRQTLEQFFCRRRGLPVVITRTPRMVLRESTPEDFETLRCMEQEAGWQFDVTETREKYLSYLKYAYSFYGYGYWSAELASTGEMVGWCGFTAWGMENPDPDFLCMKIENPQIRPEQQALELGYLVEKSHRRQGLALEMCRAAISYGFKYLDAGAIWVRIRRTNQASLRLAEKLGFQE